MTIKEISELLEAKLEPVMSNFKDNLHVTIPIGVALHEINQNLYKIEKMINRIEKKDAIPELVVNEPSEYVKHRIETNERYFNIKHNDTCSISFNEGTTYYISPELLRIALEELIETPDFQAKYGSIHKFINIEYFGKRKE